MFNIHSEQHTCVHTYIHIHMQRYINKTKNTQTKKNIIYYAVIHKRYEFKEEKRKRREITTQ